MPRPSNSRYAIALLALVSMLAAGCDRSGNRGTYVARVNNAVLTERDLAVSRDSLGETAARSREYVNEWIITEMLYQEAERRGLTETQPFQSQLEAARKRLAVATLLEEEVYGPVDSSAITEEAVKAFFDSSGTAFALRDDVVQVSYIIFQNREAANAFRSRVLRGMPWDGAKRELLADPALRQQVVHMVEHEYVTRAMLYPEELWRLARSLPRDDVSFPLKTNDGYYVLQVHRVLRPGEVPPLDYARLEVRAHLLMDLRRSRYEEFLGALRGRHSVDIREPAIDAGDSLSKE